MSSVKINFKGLKGSNQKVSMEYLFKNFNVLEKHLIPYVEFKKINVLHKLINNIKLITLVSSLWWNFLIKNLVKDAGIFFGSNALVKFQKSFFNLFFIKKRRVLSKLSVDSGLTLIGKRRELFLLHVTFKKRNIFFNVKNNYGNSCYMTTLRREGFIGRRQGEYVSVFSTMGIVKTYIQSLNIKKIGLIYSGWNRFRNAVKNSFVKKNTDKNTIHLKYIKYTIKIPHNGCRLSKKTNRESVRNKMWYQKN